MSVPRPHSEGVMLPSDGDLHSQPRERMLVVVSGEFSYNIYFFSVQNTLCEKSNLMKLINVLMLYVLIVILSC